MATTTTYPPGGTFFSTVKRSFVDVPVAKDNDNAIPTTEFLEAAESLTTLFDVLGSVAFNVVKSDMLGNVKKIRDRQLAFPAESTTIQDLVRNELKSKKHVATEGLLWLVRGLEFTLLALQSNLNTSTEELNTSFTTAYGKTLKPHHSFIVKPIFAMAMSAVPYRADFYKKLGAEGTEGLVLEKLKEWLDALGVVVSVLKEFLARKEAKF